VSRRGFTLFAPRDEHTDLGGFPAAGHPRQELIEPAAKLLDRAGSATGGNGVEQIGGDNANGDQAGQGRLNSLDQIDDLPPLCGSREGL
jgi:hypothetical protein